MTTTLPAAPASAGVDANELRVTRVRPLRGPNYWRLAPVIACDVRLGSLEHVHRRAPGFSDRLLDALPTLREHPCSRGTRGRVRRAAERGHALPHVLEHVSLELQTLAGSDVSFGRVVPSGDEGVWWVIVAYEEEAVGVESMHEAARLVRASIDGQVIDAGDTRARYPAAVRDGAARTVERRRSSRRRAGAGSRYGASTPLASSQLGLGRNLRRIQATVPIVRARSRWRSPRTRTRPSASSATSVCGAEGRRRPHGDDAIDVAQDIGFPVIVKPLDASHGRGISRRTRRESSLRQAFDVAQTFSRRVVIEQFALGNDHRVLVVNGRVAACAERVPARVFGDGAKSVRALIEQENRDPRRGIGHTKILTHLPTDEETIAYLASQALTLDSVPADGQQVFLRRRRISRRAARRSTARRRCTRTTSRRARWPRRRSASTSPGSTSSPRTSPCPSARMAR
jgi:cyanophycin synthetase